MGGRAQHQGGQAQAQQHHEEHRGHAMLAAAPGGQGRGHAARAHSLRLDRQEV